MFQVGMIPHKMLRATHGVTKDNFALTAYVAIALLESGYKETTVAQEGSTVSSTGYFSKYININRGI